VTGISGPRRQKPAIIGDAGFEIDIDTFLATFCRAVRNFIDIDTEVNGCYTKVTFVGSSGARPELQWRIHCGAIIFARTCQDKMACPIFNIVAIISTS